MSDSSLHSKGKRLTAGELMKQLAQDPQYQERMRQKAEHRHELTLQHRLVVQPVVAELQQVGYVVNSIDELRRSGVVYGDAIPVLVKWLPVIGDRGVKDSIVRSLSVPWASIAVPHLMEEFRRPDSEVSLRWTIGNALEVLANDAMFKGVCELVRDKRYGIARQMLVLALGKMKDPAAVDVLLELLNDDDVAGHALMALGKLKAKKARAGIEPFLKHPKAWFRQEARKALKKLDN